MRILIDLLGLGKYVYHDNSVTFFVLAQCTGRRPAVFNSSTVLFVRSYFPVLEFRSVQFDGKVTKTRNQ